MRARRRRWRSPRCIAAPAPRRTRANGKTLYKTYCQVCHTVDPPTTVAPFNVIMTAANNPAQIARGGSRRSVADGLDHDRRSTASQLADIAAYLGTFGGAAATVAVVEFYNAARDHYFMSAAPRRSPISTAACMPAGCARAFRSRRMQRRRRARAPCAASIFRLRYGDSHFYSASPAECAQVAAKYPGFVYETPAVFYIALPDAATGACPAGTIARVSRVGQSRRHQSPLHDEPRRAPADAGARLDRRRLRAGAGHHVRAAVGARRALRAISRRTS